MTEDDLKRKLTAQKREFPETMDLLAKVRAALAEKVFTLPITDAVGREAMCLRVQTLDAMIGEMKTLLTHGANQDAIDAYAKQFATTESR